MERRKVSKICHGEKDLIVRVWPTQHLSGTRISFRYDEWGQLVYAAEGSITVETPDGAWVVPPHRAVWVPPATPHEVVVHGRTTLRSLYLRENPKLSKRSCTLGLTPLARELILHIAAVAPLTKTKPEHRRLAAVLIDHLHELPVLPVYLPQPRTVVAQNAASLLTEWSISTVEVASHVGLSLRSLERLFKEETGLSLGAWRQQARLMESLRLLSQGESVGNVAFQVGYAGDSAFIYAFRRAFGIPPGAFYGGTLAVGSWR